MVYPTAVSTGLQISVLPLTMRRFLRTGQWVMAEWKRSMIRSYSLSHEAAEKIKTQLDDRDARLFTPENADPSSEYKGLVIVSTPFCGYGRAVKIFCAPYLGAGLPVIFIINVTATIVFNTPAQRKMSRVFNVVSANITQPCPVVMKLYCASSSTYIPVAANEFSKPGCKLKLVGAIFDSGPPLQTPMSTIRANRFMSSLNLFPTWFHRMAQLLPLLFLAVVNVRRKRVAFERVMYSPFLNDIPQLYVYSAIDEVIDTDYINKLIDYQRQHNADVTVHTFSDTVHMLHRWKYPNEYDKLLLDFLAEKCDMPT